MSSVDFLFQPATAMAAAIRRKEVSARETMQAHLDQIARVNPTINAIVSMLDPEQCLALADAADRKQAAGESLGVLHGLPIAFKDLIDATPFPTTQGSRIFKDFRPAKDAALVERLRGAGALGIGKTNVPEFGLGSHTFNDVFGPTRNPYDQGRTAGGSSGGAGAALATGMLPIADGSDMGGSLRNPGNFNNVVGFRPTAGLVPRWPTSMPWLPLSVVGPLARTVGDVALMMQAIAGRDPRDQMSYDIPAGLYAQPLARSFAGARIAWSPDLGQLPLDPRVRAVLESQRHVFADLGAEVVAGAPDLSGADVAFRDLRAFNLAAGMSEVLKTHRALMKPEAIWNIESGMALSAVDVGKAMILQNQVYETARAFMETHEFLICAVNQVPPFPIETRYPTEIDGVPMENYIAWMKSAYWITTSRLPAISVPCGFTPEGLPVGVQIVGRPGADFAVLQLAQAFEQATGVWKQRPAIAG
jgi:amidase